MPAESIRNSIRAKKKQTLRFLEEGKLTTIKTAPSSAVGNFWSNLLRIKSSSSDLFEPFVQCNVCHKILSYESKYGTHSLSLHVESCLNKTSSNSTTTSIKQYMKKEETINADDKQKITLACSKYCAFDMQSFASVKGTGFQQLCQILLEVGYKYGELKRSLPLAESILPDPTNVSRRIQHLAAEYRLKLNEILKEDLKSVKLIGVSGDYWKNFHTSENYLTVNLHYTKDTKPATLMLSTSLFVGSKTGEATVRVMHQVLESYGIDPNNMHIIYLTDNGSNFVSGLKDEVHLRCICKFIQLI